MKQETDSEIDVFLEQIKVSQSLDILLNAYLNTEIPEVRKLLKKCIEITREKLHKLMEGRC